MDEFAGRHNIRDKDTLGANDLVGQWFGWQKAPLPGTHWIMETAPEVRSIVSKWLGGRVKGIGLGLPEWDHRLNLWRIAFVNGKENVGEVRVLDGKVVWSSDLNLAERRNGKPAEKPTGKGLNSIVFPVIPSRIILGDARDVLEEFPPDAVQLIFTSPPYFNAKPECFESLDYENYLQLLRDVFQRCHDILSEGRFIVVNTSPVLIKRPNRSTSSKRIPITFDVHSVLNDVGFEFIDDIVWQKPEGAGWNLGRGRRFAADRQPLQYKAVTVTENIIVYRKRTDRLIDWNIRNHPDPSALEASLIADDYEENKYLENSSSSSQNTSMCFPGRASREGN